MKAIKKLMLQNWVRILAGIELLMVVLIFIFILRGFGEIINIGVAASIGAAVTMVLILPSEIFAFETKKGGRLLLLLLPILTGALMGFFTVIVIDMPVAIVSPSGNNVRIITMPAFRSPVSKIIHLQESIHQKVFLDIALPDKWIFSCEAEVAFTLNPLEAQKVAKRDFLAWEEECNQLQDSALMKNRLGIKYDPEKSLREQILGRIVASQGEIFKSAGYFPDTSSLTIKLINVALTSSD